MRPLLFVLAGCAGSARDSGSPRVAEVESMAPEAVLTRMSLDLRGVRPSLDELDTVGEDPAALATLREAYLSDARLADRVVALYGEIWNTVRDETEHPAEAVGLGNNDAWSRAVGEEPLRVLAEVMTQDLPYTTLVTADWTVVDDQLAQAWPVEATSGTGWRRATYTDGRPAAGALATNGLWWRYETSSNNANRARANQVSRILLCRDYLDAEVTFDRSVDLSDEEVVRDALTENPGCVNCHSSLDPLASALSGFFVPRKSGLEEYRHYHPEREGLWRTQTGVPPAYFGEPVSTVGELGQAIAGDPRFVSCAVEQAAGLLLRRDLTLEDTTRLTRWREAFLADGLRLKALWRAILDSDAYTAADPNAPLALDRKLVAPEQLASQVEDLTGYRFTLDGIDLLRNSDVGLRALAGGGDGRFATGGVQDYTASLALVQDQLAWAAAWHAVHTDPERLPAGIDLEKRASADAVTTLHRRVLGRTPSAAEQTALVDHFEAAADLEGPQAAWASLLAVLLMDPEFLLY